MSGIPLDEVHGPGEGIGEDGLSAMFTDDLFPSFRDPLNRLWPGNGLELAGALGTGSEKGGG